MSEQTPLSSGTSRLRPKARILRTFGDELISSEVVALVELVKNSYDADATRVVVRFTEPLEVGQGRIEVIDNGHGMSLETIQTTWMEPATLFRKRQTYSEEHRRRVLGEKGIGRFAASRLADKLEVVTRRPDAPYEVRVLFDWLQFDDESKYLDQVAISWEQIEPADICPSGGIEALWEADVAPEAREVTHGTILRMDGLRKTWGGEQLLDLRAELSRLISPYWNRDHAPERDVFQVMLQLPAEFNNLSGLVDPPEVLESPHYTLSGQVDESGRYTLTTKLRGETAEKVVDGRCILPGNRQPLCGPFRIELRVWDRDAASMNQVAHEYGSTTRDVRGDLNQAAGISIYRDGFRVLPYGDRHNDWLRLDIRRVQDPTRRLSNNQIVGHVFVSANQNPLLRDQSNREGLMVGQALDDLRRQILCMLNELETRRHALRRHAEKPQRGGVFTGFDLAALANTISKRYPQDAELLVLVQQTDADLGNRVEQVQEVLARYRRLATLGQLVDTILHDGRLPLTKIGNEAQLGLRDIDRAKTESSSLAQRLRQRFSFISGQADVLATLFRKIEPFGGRKRGRPVQTRLEQVIADAFSVLQTEVNEVKAKVALPGTSTPVTVDQSEIQQVIINLLQNSLYWLRSVSPENRKIQVSVSRRQSESDAVEVTFSDSGPGVQPEFRDRIFEPYFSTKPDGIGLGLAIAGEIVAEYYSGDLELLDSGPLPGATFRIVLRRRV